MGNGGRSRSLNGLSAGIGLLAIELDDCLVNLEMLAATNMELLWLGSWRMTRMHPRKTGSLELEPRYSDQTDGPGRIQLTKC